MYSKANRPETMTRKLIINCLLSSLFLIFLQILHPAKTQAQFAVADALLQQNSKQYGGQLAALVWKDDSLYYKKEIGEFNINTQVPMGAASSWMTVALVMHFVDQGKLSLDDPVSRYLPVFAKYSKGYLTIRHCLTHTTGLETEKGGIEKFFQRKKFGSLEEEVESFASKREIINNPGEAVSYSNMGINIAGRVLEVVGKKSFDRLMAEKITRPLGMKRTTFSSEYAVNPYSGAISTPSDFVRFLTMLLNKGTYKGKKILSEESVQSMETYQNKELQPSPLPLPLQGYDQSFAAWVQQKDSNGNPQVLVSPGLIGGFVYLDKCRNTAGVIAVKAQPKEEKENIYLKVKEAVDATVSCK